MRRFRPNREMAAQLRQQSQYRDGLAEAAEAAREHAERFAQQARAPWMPRKGTGTAQTIVVEKDADGVSLVNTDHAGAITEWGSKNNAPHAPLRRGVRAAGLRLTED